MQNAEIPDDEIDAILEEASGPLVAAWDKLKNRRDYLAGQIRLADERLKRVERSLRPLRPDLFEPTPKPKPPPKSKPSSSIGPKRWAEALAWVGGVGLNGTGSPAEFTQKMMREVTGWNSGMSAILFARMREEEIIRLVRSEGNLRFYKIISEEALHLAIIESEEDRASAK